MPNVEKTRCFWENGFHSSGHCDLDLWPTDPKIKRVLQLNKSNHPMKFEGSSSKRTRVIERKRFSLFGSLWPWPLTFDLLTPKSEGVFYSIRATTLWSLKALAQRVLNFLSGNGFHSSSHCDLDLWPTDPKINRGLLFNHPMKFEGSGSKGTRVIERKRISLFVSLWPWPLTYWPQNH